MDDRDAELGRLSAFVAGRDVPCPACGYNLRDLRSDRCPECGEGLTLRINLAEPRLGMFLAGVVGLAMGLGFNATVLVWAVVERLTAGFVSWRDMWTLALSVLVLAPALRAWVDTRTAVRRMQRPVQAALVAGAWVLTAGSAVLFFVVID